jgi:excisionase family DNA binding protein
MSDPVTADEQFYDTTRVANIFNVTQETVVNWIKRGILDGTKIGKAYRIPRASVLALANSKYGEARVRRA